MSLDIQVTKKRDFVYTVELKGSLDTETYKDLETELKEIIDGKTKVIMLDMTNLTYISSAGIGIVMWAKKECKKSDINFSVVNLQPQIKKVFDAMKILPMISIFENMPEADQYIDQIIDEELRKQSA